MANMINLTINGKNVSVEKGTTIIEAAKKVGIDIPNLCYEKSLTAFAGCRMCVVEIEGSRKLETACSTLVKEGMVVNTESDKLTKIRRNILDLLFSNHPSDCLTCDMVGNCKLQEYCYRYGMKKGTWIGEVQNHKIDDNNPVMIRDQNKCILCGKCVRVCQDVQVTGAIDFVDRGFEAHIGTHKNLDLSTDNCRFCGQCISV